MMRTKLIPFFVLLALNTGFAEQTPPLGLFIEGYPGKLSYAPGEEITFHVSTSASSYSMQIMRVGVKDEVVWEKKGLHAGAHKVPDLAASHGCGWPVSFKLKVPKEWKSGYYRANLEAKDKGGKYTHRNERWAKGSLYFVIRSGNPGKDTKILLQLSTNTYSAYNNWGGHSLYSYHDRDQVQGHRVSFHRPGGSLFYIWEVHFARWAEKNGYKLDYAVNNDLEFHPEMLSHYNLVLSIGHDEYWSSPMRDNLEGFIGKGGNVAFFSGNTCCWQIRNEQGGRDFTCWKQWYNLDPVFRNGDQKLVSTLWGHHLINRPENEMTGVGFLWGGYHRSHGQFMDGKGSYTVHRPDHWVFKGTKLKKNDEFGGKDTIVGYECDGCEFVMKDGLPVPTYKDGTPKSFVILGTCPASWAAGDRRWYDRFPEDRTGASVLGVYTRGGTVFTSGSTDWSHGLSRPDPIVDRITRNVLDRLSK